MPRTTSFTLLAFMGFALIAEFSRGNNYFPRQNQAGGRRPPIASTIYARSRRNRSGPHIAGATDSAICGPAENRTQVRN